MDTKLIEPINLKKNIKEQGNSKVNILGNSNLSLLNCSELNTNINSVKQIILSLLKLMDMSVPYFLFGYGP